MADEFNGKLISVVIPFTEENDNLERSVNSVIYQKNVSELYEIIIINGCGNGANARLEAIESKMPESIILVVPESKMRKCDILNLGIDYAGGKYALFLNAGDELNRNLFNCIEKVAEKADPDVITYGMTKALESFEYFGKEPFDEYSFSLLGFEIPAQRKAFLSGEDFDARYLCNAYNTGFLRNVGQRFSEEALDDDFTFAYPLFFFADRIAVTKDHGYCSFSEFDGEPDNKKTQERIATRLDLQLKLLELMQSVPEIYREYQDVIEAHFFYEYFLKSLDLIEAFGGKNALSEEVLQIMKLVTLKIIPKWNENDYVCGFCRREIDRIKYLFDDEVSASGLCEELQKTGKVSVVIATHNRSKYLTNSIKCILTQTWKNLELVIVDDGSDDDTEGIVNSFKDERIVYSKNECNKGISYSRNKGIELASGKYIVFQDDDDYCRLDKIEKQVVFMEKQSPTVGMAYCVTANHCNALRGNEDVPLVLIPSGKEKLYVGCSGFIYPKLLPKNFIACTAMIIRKECFDIVGPFDESLFAYEDWDITLRIAKQYEVGIIKEILYDYYQRNNGLASNKDPEHRRKVLESLNAIDGKYKSDMKKYGIESKFVIREA